MFGGSVARPAAYAALLAGVTWRINIDCSVAKSIFSLWLPAGIIHRQAALVVHFNSCGGPDAIVGVSGQFEFQNQVRIFHTVAHRVRIRK